LTDLEDGERFSTSVGECAETPHANLRRLMAMKTGLLYIVAVGLVGLSSPALAHHGDADRYMEDVIDVTGTVVELKMVNPHAHILFDVTDATGKTVRWEAELGGPQQLMKQFGWTPLTVKIGMKLTMTGRRLKSGAPYMNLTERARIVDAATGKEIFRTENFGQPPPKQ
jgi:hypothetical protein